MSKYLTKFGVIFYLLTYYFVGYWLLLEEKPNPEFPYLRVRFGTIMWHSADAKGIPSAAFYDPNAASHTYCYYPKGETSYENKSGEYIIKREDDGNCEGWLGQAIFYEGSWVSEREKIWWNKDQKIIEDLVTEKTSDLSI